MRAVLVLMSLAAFPVLLPANQGGNPPNGWKEYSPKDRSFTVWLPEQAGRKSERERALFVSGQSLKLNTVQLDLKGGLFYNAGTVILPLTLARKTTQARLVEIFRDAFVDEVKGKIDVEQEIRQGPVTGREYIILTGQGQAKFRLFVAGTRVYRVMVHGTKAQVESRDALTFLDSYKLPTAATDPGAKGKDDKVVGQPAKVIPGELFAFLRAAVNEKRLAEVDLRGMKLGKETYRDVAKEGGILIGFEVGLGKFLNNPVVSALRPIYLTRDGEASGEWCGKVPDQKVTLKAKPGYVVGAVTLRAGLIMDGLSLTYVKLDKDRLQTDDSYKSEHVGSQGGNVSTIGGQGYLFVGIFGHLNNDQATCSLGLVTVLLPKE